MENDYSIKIVEANEERCEELAKMLSRTVVLNGSASDQELLREENIEDTDVFLALTNSDEANVMASLLAKKMGAHKVITLINKPAYVDLVQSSNIDIAISPQQITIGALLTHVRRGDVVSVHSLRRGAAEAIELVAHGDEQTSKVVGRAIEEIDLPESAMIGAIVRKKEINDQTDTLLRSPELAFGIQRSKKMESDYEVLIAHDDLIIESGDHVIVFLLDKRYTHHVERLFQVGFSFF